MIGHFETFNHNKTILARHLHLNLQRDPPLVPHRLPTVRIGTIGVGANPLPGDEKVLTKYTTRIRWDSLGEIFRESFVGKKSVKIGLVFWYASAKDRILYTEFFRTNLITP